MARIKTILLSIYLIIIMLFAGIGVCDAQEYNLYRNKEYQFSLDIPAAMNIIESRGPNIKMTASTPKSNFIMSVLVKNSPAIKEADDDFLLWLHQDSLSQTTSDYYKFINCDIINIPNHKVLVQLWTAKHTYPSMTFYQDVIMFHFVTNYKYFLITYYTNQGDMKKYIPAIEHSIGSFVDETGWY
ncbi:hypothetical protein [Selenomonas sp. AB3002]|uniref:hypothetical protein n=1 Tax=Selenomonas sp. AB3002 TaxID=1392502 RepID=UPI00049658A3